MNHLINDFDLDRIEGQLLKRRDQLVQASSWAFNLAALVLIVGSFLYFLYVQYSTQDQRVQEEEKRIPFTPVTWYSATRNVRSEEYGRQLQPFEAETGYGVSGFADGGGTEAFL